MRSVHALAASIQITQSISLSYLKCHSNYWKSMGVCLPFVIGNHILSAMGICFLDSVLEFFPFCLFDPQNFCWKLDFFTKLCW